ncbi:MAG: serine protease [Bdellovibrionota bacterium]
MKEFFTKKILSLILALSASSASAAIYGADNRQDVFFTGWLKKQAAATAAAVPNIFVLKNDDGTFRIDEVDVMAGGWGVNLCKDERFANQPSLGHCTGFLISDRYLVTAGHCALATGTTGEDENNPFCKAFSWYFNYNVDGSGQTTHQRIPPHHYYTCKKMIRAENIELPGLPGANYGNDFALIELDRPVIGIEPLKVNADRSQIKVKNKVFTIGHPSGMPAKYSGKSEIINNQNPYSFKVNLDTQGGNSGSPVFNDENEVIGILVSGHPVDYYTDAKLQCNRPNVCNSDGSTCNEQSKFEGLEVSNSVLYLDIVMHWLPKK